MKLSDIQQQSPLRPPLVYSIWSLYDFRQCSPQFQSPSIAGHIYQAQTFGFCHTTKVRQTSRRGQRLHSKTGNGTCLLSITHMCRTLQANMRTIKGTKSRSQLKWRPKLCKTCLAGQYNMYLPYEAILTQDYFHFAKLNEQI